MGSVSADKSKLVEGETTNIYATNKSGYQFSGWTVTSGSCTVSGVSTATSTADTVYTGGECSISVKCE